MKLMREVPVDDYGQKEIAKRLRQIGVFQKWKDADLQELAKYIHVRDFDTGDYLREERGTGDYLYMVVSGTVRERDMDEKGTVWAERTWTPDQWFVRQASYEGIFHDAEIRGDVPGSLYAIFPVGLSWALGIQPDLWDALRRDPIARRLRSFPVLATLGPEQIHRLSNIAQSVDFTTGATICEPQSTLSQAMVYFIDWGQVALGELLDSFANVITAGNFFHNGPNHLGAVAPSRAIARTDVRLIGIPFADMEIWANLNEGIRARLQRPPIKDYLRLVKDFEALSDEQLDALASISSWEHFPAARTISLQGVRGDSLRILQRGAAIVRVVDAQGRERPRSYLAPGAYYGIGSLFRQDRHHATVRAVLPDQAGTVDGYLTSSIGQKDSLQQHEPGATWLRLCYDDLYYLLHTFVPLWKNSPLVQQVAEEVKTYRKYDWQEQDEVIVFDGRRHPIILVGRLLWLVLIFGIIMLIDVVWRGAGGGGVPALGIVLFVLLALMPAGIWIVVDYLNDYFVVTNRRVAARERIILVYESLNEAALHAVQDTTIGVDFWGNLFQYGTLVVKTAAKSAWVVFDRIPRPRDVQRTITEQQQRVQAELRVEQRENLRSQIITDLRVGIVPQVHLRALPANLVVTKPPGFFTRVGNVIHNVLDKTIYAAVRLLILRPIRFFVTTFLRRGRDQPGSVEEFHGGLLACWWITPEKTVWRKHWLILFRNIWVSLLVWAIVFALFFVRFLPSGTLPWWLVGLVLGVVTFWLGWQYANWANDLYVVTNEKLVDIERLPLGFGEKRREGNLDRVQNVVLKIPNFWANLFKVGNVEIQTAATDEGFTFIQVANPRGVQREVWRRINIHQANRLRRESATMQSQQAMVLGVYHELMQETRQYKD